MEKKSEPSSGDFTVWATQDSESGGLGAAESQDGKDALVRRVQVSGFNHVPTSGISDFENVSVRTAAKDRYTLVQCVSLESNEGNCTSSAGLVPADRSVTPLSGNSFTSVASNVRRLEWDSGADVGCQLLLASVAPPDTIANPRRTVLPRETKRLDERRRANSVAELSSARGSKDSPEKIQEQSLKLSSSVYSNASVVTVVQRPSQKEAHGGSIFQGSSDGFHTASDDVFRQQHENQASYVFANHRFTAGDDHRSSAESTSADGSFLKYMVGEDVPVDSGMRDELEHELEGEDEVLIVACGGSGGDDDGDESPVPPDAFVQHRKHLRAISQDGGTKHPNCGKRSGQYSRSREGTAFPRSLGRRFRGFHDASVFRRWVRSKSETGEESEEDDVPRRHEAVHYEWWRSVSDQRRAAVTRILDDLARLDDLERMLLDFDTTTVTSGAAASETSAALRLPSSSTSHRNRYHRRRRKRVDEQNRMLELQSSADVNVELPVTSTPRDVIVPVPAPRNADAASAEPDLDSCSDSSRPMRSETTSEDRRVLNDVGGRDAAAGVVVGGAATSTAAAAAAHHSDESCSTAVSSIYFAAKRPQERGKFRLDATLCRRGVGHSLGRARRPPTTANAGGRRARTHRSSERTADRSSPPPVSVPRPEFPAAPWKNALAGNRGDDPKYPATLMAQYLRQAGLNLHLNPNRRHKSDVSSSDRNGNPDEACVCGVGDGGRRRRVVDAEPEVDQGHEASAASNSDECCRRRHMHHDHHHRRRRHSSSGSSSANKVVVETVRRSMARLSVATSANGKTGGTDVGQNFPSYSSVASSTPFSASERRRRRHHRTAEVAAAARSVSVAVQADEPSILASSGLGGMDGRRDGAASASVSVSSKPLARRKPFQPLPKSVSFYVPFSKVPVTSLSCSVRGRRRRGGDDEPPSLQEALAARRPAFVSRAVERQEVLAVRAFLRERAVSKRRRWLMEEEQKKRHLSSGDYDDEDAEDVYDNRGSGTGSGGGVANNGSDSGLEMAIPPPPVSQREMKRRTKAKYQRLPEVKSAAEARAVQRERELNRVMARLYKERLLRNVLRGRVNLSHDACVV